MPFSLFEAQEGYFFCQSNVANKELVHIASNDLGEMWWCWNCIARIAKLARYGTERDKGGDRSV